MKIQCSACQMAEATVVCCADEAALCRACDEKVHAANKLASKHQRVPLSSPSSHMPKCDICQEAVGYFFCLEDRALLCRKCDVAIHTVNAYVSGHQRFLLTGVKVGLEPTEPVASSAKDKLNSAEKFRETQSRSLSRKDTSVSLSSDNNEVISSQPGGNGGLPASRASFSGTMSGMIPEWPLEDVLGMTDFSQNYGFFETGSSKADGSKLEDSEWSPTHCAAADDEVNIGDCLSHVPEIPWVVPDIPSPPTASGLHWPKKFEDSFLVDNSVSVPDVNSLPSLRHNQPVSSKRRRHAQHVIPGSWV